MTDRPAIVHEDWCLTHTLPNLERAANKLKAAMCNATVFLVQANAPDGEAR